MKNRFFCLFLIVCLLLSSTAFAVGGDENDPVVSYSYLEQVWKADVLKQVAEIAKESIQAEKSRLYQSLAQSIGTARLQDEMSFWGLRRQHGRVMLKAGDVFIPRAGAKFSLLDGEMTSYGAVADVTLGVAVADGQSMAKNHLFMQKDNYSANIQVTSESAELWVDGLFELHRSSATDFGSLAEALYAMGLFRGTDTNFALERSTTRIEGLVMFLRLLGLEENALACTKSVPFGDIPADYWAKPYIAYAYHEGLTAGTGDGKFSPNAPITAQQYLTFLLRALHHKEGSDFTYDSAYLSAESLGLFSSREIAELSQKTLT
ncbi:MAG: S-layer homology domain-containing protein, partial [Oscillospiraceae bacterium]|nr:S-layer homology domain-containing protein [Oscillospiraceae bacterium]